MLRKLTFQIRSEEEEIKEAGLNLDFDEIARKGVMSGGEKLIAKWYGIYGSRQPGNHMARVVIPGGVITSHQARVIAKTSEKYGQGVLNITTRQAIQFHWLKIGALADMIRELNKGHLSTFHGCGDVTRNVAACQLADTCEYSRINVRKFAVDTQNYLGSFRDLDNLPRKFKVTYSGCNTGCGQPYINCLGAIAQKVEINGKEEFGFKVVIGGGMGWKAFVAQELFSFVPQDQMLEVSRAIALLFRDHGDRFNRVKSRLKYVVHRKGIDFCRTEVLKNLEAEGNRIDNLLIKPITEIGGETPKQINPYNYKAKDGTYSVGIRVVKGEFNYRQLNAIAELSEEFGDQKVYTTNRQNLELKGVEKKNIEKLQAKISELGFDTEGFLTIKDIVPCVGLTYCPKAVASTRTLHDLIQPIVQQEKYKDIQNKVLINITGCPNSCSPYRIIDVGFRGMRIREGLGSVEGYEMLIGGSQESFGKKLGEFKEADAVEVLETVLDTYVKQKEGDETLTETVKRVGLETFKEAVYNEI